MDADLVRVLVAPSLCAPRSCPGRRGRRLPVTVAAGTRVTGRAAVRSDLFLGAIWRKGYKFALASSLWHPYAEKRYPLRTPPCSEKFIAARNTKHKPKDWDFISILII